VSLRLLKKLEIYGEAYAGAAASGEGLRFNQALNSFEIDSAILDTPLNDTDPYLLRIVREQADGLLQNLADTDAIEVHVRLLIMKELEHGSPRAEHIARELGMSLSTFRRRLAEKDLTFRGLRGGVICELAKTCPR